MNETKDDLKREKVRIVPISNIEDFPDHPFQVKDDESMDALVESIRMNGVLNPVIALKIDENHYQLISGHRRKHACVLLGIDRIPLIGREMTKEEAVIEMVDAFLDKNIPFELEYGVKGMVTERKKKFRDTYIKFNIIAACVCIFSPIPLIISGFTENELLVIMMLAVMMIVAGIGASIFIVVGVQNASMQKLLKEGEFTEKEKKRTSVKEAVGFAYWGVLTAIFFIWGFLGNDGSGIQGNSWISWRYNWIVFAVGGILFPIVMMLCNLIADKDKKD